MSTTTKKYTEIYSQIKEDIESGVYKINEKLPQGRLLAQKYQVSELTITKALNVLVREGYIVRRRGSGSFVKDFHNKKMTKYSPLTGSFSVYDGNVESVIIGFTTEIPDKSLADKLGIDQETLVYKIIRMRKVEGIPSIIEYTWMPTNVISGLTMKELETSIYKYISDTLKLKVKSAHVNIAGVRPSILEKKYLNLTDTDFLMSVEQVAYLDDGRIFEFSIANHIPSEFHFETVLIAD